MVDVDVLVIGAGIIGLAIARAFALEGREVIVVERESTFGAHASSRNSEVIHAGLYYPTSSAKARHCVRGRELLYAYCERRRIPHRRIGKLIVATHPDQLVRLEDLARQARSNGVDDIQRWDAARVHRQAPALRTAGALWSPSTGIVDSHALMQALIADAHERGASLVYRTTVQAIEPGANGLDVVTDDDRVSCRVVINAAGLFAPSLARRTRGANTSNLPVAHWAKGGYVRLSGAAPCDHLVYPLPEAGGLGVHLTLDLAGGARFGPDVTWLTATDNPPDYGLDEHCVPRFARAIAAYWPGVDPARLYPDYAGIRAKLHGPGEPAADFMVLGPGDHGIDGLVHVMGIESPGLTAALSLADDVRQRL